MTKRLISFLIALVLLIAIPLSARYRYNPYTKKLDYYEAAGDITLGDIGDITLTGLATGDTLYYNGTVWVNLPVGAGATVLTIAAGIPSWQAAGAPAAHAASHEVGGADLVDHDQLTNYLASQHLTLPNTLVAVLTDHNAAAHVALGFLALPSTIAAVLTDHNLLAHTALGLFDQSSDVDHNLTTNYLAAQHLTLPSTIVAVLTDHDKAAHDALLIDADTVDGEHAAAIVTNARVKAHFPDTIANILSDHNLAAHTALGLFDASIDVDHNATTNYAANQHVVLPATIAAVLTDHDLAAHTALGLFDASGDVDHDATTNWVANKHINWTAAADNFSTSEDFFLAWTEAADYASITQTAVAGIEDRPLILIDDDRTGATATELSESTIIIDADGVYAFYILDGAFWNADNSTFGGTALFNNTMTLTSDKHFSIGNSFTSFIRWTLNGAQDDFIQLAFSDFASTTKMIFMTAENVNPSGMTDHADYESPTLVLANSMGADANDYAGVVIGERTQADVTVAHYFDFYAMTGAIDAATDPNVAELAAIFRFGASGTTVPTYATTPGDVLFEGAIEVVNVLGYDYTTDHNLFFGYLAGEDIAGGGQFNTLIGEGAAAQLTTGDQNTVVGYQAGGNLMTTASFQTLVGYRAGYNLPADTTASYNTFVGTETGFTTTASGAMNVFIGYRAGYLNEGGYDNVFIGMIAGQTNVSGYMNVYVGNDAGSTAVGTGNTFVGGYAGALVTNGSGTLIGNAAGRFMTTGAGNTYIGKNAGYTDTDGGFNVGVGQDVQFTQDGAWFNVAMGYQAAYRNVTGQYNVALGYLAGYGAAGQSHSNNVFVGSEAGELITTGGNNVIIGFQAAEDITSGASNVIIGYMAGEGWHTTDSNKFIIGNTDTATPLLHGDFTDGDLVAASITHNSDHEVTGYNRYETVYWNDCFDHGTVASKYQFDWDITSLNTQGAGTNTVDTTPSEITLTTENNAIGDNEGTRTEFAVIQRARQNRTEWSLDLKQTANTQFYMGWNTSGTNAMVAAADEYVIVFFDVSDNANWQIKVGDGATEDVFTSAIAGAVAHIIHEVWVETDGTVHWRVNGTELDITGSVDNLMTASDHYLIVGQAQSVTGAAVIVVEIDYVENEKTKAH